MQLTPEGTRWQPLSMTRHDVFETVAPNFAMLGARGETIAAAELAASARCIAEIAIMATLAREIARARILQEIMGMAVRLVLSPERRSLRHGENGGAVACAM